MLKNYLRLTMFVLALFAMSAPAAFARSSRNKKCVQQCKAARHSSEADCATKRGAARRQGMRTAKSAFKTCKAGCPR